MVQTEQPPVSVTPPQPQFSMALNEEQILMKNWIHEFAKNVIRPAAHEWDEREETPWPIIQEAARVGIEPTPSSANALSCTS